MFKTILTSHLLGVSRNFIKLFQTNLSLHTSKAMLLKQSNYYYLYKLIKKLLFDFYVLIISKSESDWWEIDYWRY